MIDVRKGDKFKHLGVNYIVTAIEGEVVQLQEAVVGSTAKINVNIKEFENIYTIKMKTNVKSYTDRQLLERVASLGSFEGYYPSKHWLIGVRSEEDEFNKFDDKFYLFHNVSFIKVFQGTTNAGSKGLKEFHTYNKDGVAVLKADIIVYDSHIRGISKGRMVYRQDKPWPYYRDNNYNNKVEEIGKIHNDIIQAHIHDVNIEDREAVKEAINGNSLACQVFAKGSDYDSFMNLTENQTYLTYCLLKEF